MELRVIGSRTSGNITPTVQSMIDVCKKLPDGVGLTCSELASRCHVNSHTIQAYGAHEAVAAFVIHRYPLSGSRGNVYTNAKTARSYHADKDRSQTA